MFPTPVKIFVHPHEVYRLEYPAHWDHLIERDGESCSFGPHDRDEDVGLCISILPMSVDTEKMTEDLPKLMEQSLERTEATNLRRDESLKHFGLVADMTQDDEGGNYWIVAGGDALLFASTQVPVAERDAWNPLFQKIMSTLQITRDEQLQMRKIANDVLLQLREKHPDQDFKFDGDQIRGKNQVVYLSNMYREIRASPSRQDQIIKRFVSTLSLPTTTDIGHEAWDDVQNCIIPMLKPRDYINPSGPTQNLLKTEWLSDVLITYVISREKIFRFVTPWDLNRWGITAEALHERAIANLARLPWPRKLMGAGDDGGHVIVVDTNDSLASSRLLHPDLHQLFSGPLGSPFWAGIPCRNTLVLYSDRHLLRKRIPGRLRKDHKASAYPITAQPFLVTRDGIAIGTKK